MENTAIIIAQWGDLASKPRLNFFCVWADTYREHLSTLLRQNAGSRALRSAVPPIILASRGRRTTGGKKR